MVFDIRERSYSRTILLIFEIHAEIRDKSLTVYGPRDAAASGYKPERRIKNGNNRLVRSLIKATPDNGGNIINIDIDIVKGTRGFGTAGYELAGTAAVRRYTRPNRG